MSLERLFLGVALCCVSVNLTGQVKRNADNAVKDQLSWRNKGHVEDEVK
jgi:hypothetical protein